MQWVIFHNRPFGDTRQDMDILDPQTALYLAAAILAGAALGWIVRGPQVKRQMSRLLDKWQVSARLAAIEANTSVKPEHFLQTSIKHLMNRHWVCGIRWKTEHEEHISGMPSAYTVSFIDNELKIADLVKNTEVIYYMYNDDQELIGINKTICSSIRLTFENSDIEDITFFTNPDGDIFPEKDLPESSRKLIGFIWRGDERILTKDDIFDEDDNNIELVKITGVDNRLDREEDQEE